MQSKINTFFKSPSSSSSSSSSSFDALTRSPNQSSVSEDIADDLDVWEKKQHGFRNTYTRKSTYYNYSVEKGIVENSELVNETSSNDDSPKPIEPTVSKTMVVKNKKRSYAQYHLEFGQSDFVLHACSTCGIKYVAGDEKDEKIHRSFHKDYTHGIHFKGWSNERVVHFPSVEDGRIVMVLDNDSHAHKNKAKEVVTMMETELGSGWIYNKLCKVFLFITSQRVVGCAIAEPIEKAFKVVSASSNKRVNATDTKDKKAKQSILQFGAVCFRREVTRRALDDICTKSTDHEDLKAAIICEKEAVTAICGIRAIWVSPANRRKHIATKLLDAVRKSFCLESVTERSQMAFSQPTLAGKALASNYIGGGSFLVYKSNNFTSDA